MLVVCAAALLLARFPALSLSRFVFTTKFTFLWEACLKWFRVLKHYEKLCIIMDHCECSSLSHGSFSSLLPTLIEWNFCSGSSFGKCVIFFFKHIAVFHACIWKHIEIWKLHTCLTWIMDTFKYTWYFIALNRIFYSSFFLSLFFFFLSGKFIEVFFFFCHLNGRFINILMFTSLWWP